MPFITLETETFIELTLFTCKMFDIVVISIYVSRTNQVLNNKVIQFREAHSHIFRLISAYSGTIIHFQELFWHIRNPALRTSGIFRALVYSESEAYSETIKLSTMGHLAKIVNYYDCFHNISFSRSLLYKINMIFLSAGLIFRPVVFILCSREVNFSS